MYNWLKSKTNPNSIRKNSEREELEELRKKIGKYKFQEKNLIKDDCKVNKNNNEDKQSKKNKINKSDSKSNSDSEVITN